MKKIKHPDIKAGIWLDQETAFVMRMEGDADPVMEVIKSDVESRVRNPGEGKVSARFGNAFIDDQEKKQRRQRQQRQRYFKKIIQAISDVNFVYLFGPGRGKEELNNAIEKDRIFNGKVIAKESSDRLTENQLLMKTENFFSSEEFRDQKRRWRKELKQV